MLPGVEALQAIDFGCVKCAECWDGSRVGSGVGNQSESVAEAFESQGVGMAVEFGVESSAGAFPAVARGVMPSSSSSSSSLPALRVDSSFAIGGSSRISIPSVPEQGVEIFN